jgi:glutamate 5-kinase
MRSGVEVVIVSSGAIGAGLGLLSIPKRPKALSELQAIASVGQSHLMDIYNEYLGKNGYIAGQILLTQEDFNARDRFLNIRHTLNTLIRYKAVPIINENDSVSTEEIKCGDNDRISSLVADLSDSDMLIILTDVEGLYDKEGKVINYVEAVTDDIRSLCGGRGSNVSTGGMITKMGAVTAATLSGIECVIASGRRKNVVTDIVEGKEIGTRFKASGKKIAARKRWIAFGVKPMGQIFVDHGAEKALMKGDKSLLPSGVTGAKGKFSGGDLVDIVSKDMRIVARGLVNYGAGELEKIKGLKTDQIEKVLGYKYCDEVVNKDNLVVMGE